MNHLKLSSQRTWGQLKARAAQAVAWTSWFHKASASVLCSSLGKVMPTTCECNSESGLCKWKRRTMNFTAEESKNIYLWDLRNLKNFQKLFWCKFHACRAERWQMGGMDEEWQLKYSSFYNFSPSKQTNKQQNKTTTETQTKTNKK